MYGFVSNVITFYHYPIYFYQLMMKPFLRHSLDTFYPNILMIRSRNSVKCEKMKKIIIGMRSTKMV